MLLERRSSLDASRSLAIRKSSSENGLAKYPSRFPEESTISTVSRASAIFLACSSVATIRIIFISPSRSTDRWDPTLFVPLFPQNGPQHPSIYRRRQRASTMGRFRSATPDRLLGARSLDPRRFHFLALRHTRPGMRHDLRLFCAEMRRTFPHVVLQSTLLNGTSTISAC